MAKAREKSLRVILRDSKGRYATLSRARFVRIFLGNKKVFEASIPSKWRVGKRRLSIERILFQIEANYLYEKAVKRQVKKDKKAKSALKKEKISSKKTVAGKKIYKIRTFTNDYSKQIFEWVLFSKNLQKTLLTRKLDFTLKEPLVINEDNYTYIASVAYDIFYPHLKKFFHQVLRVSDDPIFLFRIKYEGDFSGEQETEFKKTGFGGERFFANSFEHFEDFLWEIFSDEEEGFGFAQKLKEYLRKSLDYGAEITGFTIEGIIKEVNDV